MFNFNEIRSLVTYCLSFDDKKSARFFAIIGSQQNKDDVLPVATYPVYLRLMFLIIKLELQFNKL